MLNFPIVDNATSNIGLTFTIFEIMIGLQYITLYKNIAGLQYLYLYFEIVLLLTLPYLLMS